jgi:L-iditol 2-dehydrogenase
VHAWRGDDGYDWVKPPVVLGHEIVGEVVAVGEGVEAPRIGDRVVPVSILGCGDCPRCAAGNGPLCAKRTVIGLSHDGGLAEFVRVPAGEVVAVPLDMPSERAALTEPLSVALHAISRLPELRAGEVVGVCGPGPVGILVAWALHRRGVEVFLVGAARDRELRLAEAAVLGIDAFAGGDRDVPVANHWIEASGSEGGLNMAVEHTEPGGRVVIVAMYGTRPMIDLNTAVRHEVELIGSYASLPADYEQAVELLSTGGEIERHLVTVFPLDAAVEALESTANGGVVKAVVAP